MPTFFGITFGKQAVEADQPSALDQATAIDADEDFEKAARTSAIGWGGVSEVGGYVMADDRLPELLGTKRHETFTGLINDFSVVATGVRLFLQMISKAEWQTLPADPLNPYAVEIAEAVEKMRDSHTRPWHQIVRKQAMYQFSGFNVQEWVAGKDDQGNIAIVAVEPRPNRTIVRWDLEDSGEVKGVWQQIKFGPEVNIPRDRLIYSVDSALTESPEGVGLLRHAVRACVRLKAFEQIEEVAFDTDLRGIPIARGPWDEVNENVKSGAISAAVRTAMRAPFIKFLKGHVRNRKTGLMMDSAVYTSADEAKTPSSIYKWNLELMRGESQAFEPMAKAIARLNHEIAILLGIEHVLLGADGAGSLALSKSKTTSFYLNVISALRDLVETFEADWLKPICEMNGWPTELWPTLAVEEISDLTIEEITQALEGMARSGVMLTPMDEAVRELFGMLGLTPPEPDLEPSTAPTEDDIAPVEKSANRRLIRSRRARAMRR